MAATDLRCQFLAENSQLRSIRGAHVRREVSIDRGSPPQWSKENQLRKPRGGQPGETTAIVQPAESEAPVAVKPMPAQVGDLESLAAHRLHRIPEERLDLTNLDTLAWWHLPNAPIQSWREDTPSARPVIQHSGDRGDGIPVPRRDRHPE